MGRKPKEDEVLFDCRGIKIGEVVLFYNDGEREILSLKDYEKRMRHEVKND